MSLWRKDAASSSAAKADNKSTHSDTTLSMLRRGGGVDVREEKVLAPWEWSENEAVLHWDERVSGRLSGRLALIAFTAHANKAESILR